MINSPIVINMPTRELLAGETEYFCLTFSTFNRPSDDDPEKMPDYVEISKINKTVPLAFFNVQNTL